MSLSTTYKGHSCSYSENQDTWNCYELEFYGFATLTALKRKIDTHERKKRKLAELIPAYRISHDGKIDRVAISVIADKEVKQTQSFQRGVTVGSAWVLRETREGLNKERSKESLDQLVPATPENETMLRTYRTLREEAEAARNAAKDFAETIPRFTYDELVAAGVTLADTEDA